MFRRFRRLRGRTTFILTSLIGISVLNFLLSHVTIEIKTNIQWKAFVDDTKFIATNPPEVTSPPVVQSNEEGDAGELKNKEQLPVKNFTDREPEASNKKTRVNYQPITCNQCFKRDYDVMHEPSAICNIKYDAPDFVAVILTTPRDFESRDALRRTWLKFAHNNTAKRFRYVFLLGKGHTKEAQELVDTEVAEYGDILQHSFHESYYNLTLKSLMGLEYAVKHCLKAKYVLKVDSDVFVSVPKLLKLIENQKTLTEVLGSCKWTLPPLRSAAYKRWHVTYKEYNQTVYPPYCDGPRYLVPMPVARTIVNTSPNVPFYKMEDVYMGMVLAVTDFNVKNIVGFHSQTSFNGQPPEEVDCEKVSRIFTTHKTNAHDMIMIWNKCFRDLSLKLTMEPPAYY